MQFTEQEKVDLAELGKGIARLRAEIFESWWNRIGARFAQSLMVVSENATVKQKLEQVYNAGWDQGL